MLRITAEYPKTERGPISTSGPSLFSMSPNQAIPADKSIHFSPLAAAPPLTILSWPEALNASGSRRACRMGISRNSRPLLITERLGRAARLEFGDKEKLDSSLTYEPDLNDGVVLNITPLHEVVSWKEAEAYWYDLMKGEYEWPSIGKQLRQKGLVK